MKPAKMHVGFNNISYKLCVILYDYICHYISCTVDKMKLTKAIAFFSYGFSSHSYLPRRFRLCKIGCVFFFKLKLQPTTVLLGGLNVLNPLSKDVSSLQKLPLCNLYQIEI
jgi:hypothetical protein